MMEHGFWKRSGSIDKSSVHRGKFLSSLNPKKRNYGPVWVCPSYKLSEKGKIQDSPWLSRVWSRASTLVKLRADGSASHSALMESKNRSNCCCWCVSSPDLPLAEKLQLCEAMESSGEEQDLVDEEELQRFRELKHKMILLDKAELSSAASRNKTSLPAAADRWVNQRHLGGRFGFQR